MKMNRKLSLGGAAIGALISLQAFGAGDDLPKALAFTRYEPILKHSPFAVATAVAAPTMADFAKDLFIANAAHSPDGDWVALASTTDNNFRKYLTTKEGDGGYVLSNIEWSGQVGETKVTVSKDGQFATLSFNQAVLSQGIPRGIGPVANPAAFAAPPTTDLPVNRIRPAPIPMLPTPQPRIRGVIPRSPLGRYNRTPDKSRPIEQTAAEQAIAQPEQ